MKHYSFSISAISRAVVASSFLFNAVLFNSVLLSVTSFTLSAEALNKVSLTVEELRIDKALQQMPDVFSPLSARVNLFGSQIEQARNFTALTQLIIRHGDGLWKDGVKSFNDLQGFDDRSLYWARLQMTKALRSSTAFIQLLPVQQQKLLWQFELLSRGQKDVNFNKQTRKKILVTGFDPFFLDRHIDQSNPSGLAALALDDLLISKDGVSAEIETLIVPVRFADFDQGMIEELLTPYLKKVDMIVTISMGREHFDLERFPGLRRSAKAPGNLNVFTGASAENPLKPLLNGKELPGPEFVEFSLPVLAMQKAQGDYQVNDNAKVTTLTKTFTASSLTELNNEISVAGSGGGYLSNEISYRSLILRDQYNPVLPVGHIHTPRIKAFDPKASAKIVKQIKQMLTLAIPEI